MSEFYLKMISSNGVFYEGMCNSLIVPAPDGERAVMAHHEELMIAVTEWYFWQKLWKDRKRLMKNVPERLSNVRANVCVRSRVSVNII